MIRGKDVDIIDCSANKVVIEVKIEDKDDTSKDKTDCVSEKNEFDLIFPLLDKLIADCFRYP